jgi:hypothetical protein
MVVRNLDGLQIADPSLMDQNKEQAARHVDGLQQTSEESDFLPSDGASDTVSDSAETCETSPNADHYAVHDSNLRAIEYNHTPRTPRFPQIPSAKTNSNNDLYSTHMSVVGDVLDELRNVHAMREDQWNSSKKSLENRVVDLTAQLAERQETLQRTLATMQAAKENESKWEQQKHTIERERRTLNAEKAWLEQRETELEKKYTDKKVVLKKRIAQLEEDLERGTCTCRELEMENKTLNQRMADLREKTDRLSHELEQKIQHTTLLLADNSRLTETLSSKTARLQDLEMEKNQIMEQLKVAAQYVGEVQHIEMQREMEKADRLLAEEERRKCAEALEELRKQLETGEPGSLVENRRLERELEREKFERNIAEEERKNLQKTLDREREECRAERHKSVDAIVHIESLSSQERQVAHEMVEALEREKQHLIRSNDALRATVKDMQEELAVVKRAAELSIHRDHSTMHTSSNNSSSIVHDTTAAASPGATSSPRLTRVHSPRKNNISLPRGIYDSHAHAPAESPPRSVPGSPRKNNIPLPRSAQHEAHSATASPRSGPGSPRKHIIGLYETQNAADASPRSSPCTPRRTAQHNASLVTFTGGSPPPLHHSFEWSISSASFSSPHLSDTALTFSRSSRAYSTSYAGAAPDGCARFRLVLQPTFESSKELSVLAEGVKEDIAFAAGVDESLVFIDSVHAGSVVVHCTLLSPDVSSLSVHSPRLQVPGFPPTASGSPHIIQQPDNDTTVGDSMSTATATAPVQRIIADLVQQLEEPDSALMMGKHTCLTQSFELIAVDDSAVDSSSMFNVSRSVSVLNEIGLSDSFMVTSAHEHKSAMPMPIPILGDKSDLGCHARRIRRSEMMAEELAHKTRSLHECMNMLDLERSSHETMKRQLQHEQKNVEMLQAALRSRCSAEESSILSAVLNASVANSDGDRSHGASSSWSVVHKSGSEVCCDRHTSSSSAAVVVVCDGTKCVGDYPRMCACLRLWNDTLYTGPNVRSVYQKWMHRREGNHVKLRVVTAWLSLVQSTSRLGYHARRLMRKVAHSVEHRVLQQWMRMCAHMRALRVKAARVCGGGQRLLAYRCVCAWRSILRRKAVMAGILARLSWRIGAKVMRAWRMRVHTEIQGVHAGGGGVHTLTSFMRTADVMIAGTLDEWLSLSSCNTPPSSCNKGSQNDRNSSSTSGQFHHHMSTWYDNWVKYTNVCARCKRLALTMRARTSRGKVQAAWKHWRELMQSFNRVTKAADKVFFAMIVGIQARAMRAWKAQHKASQRRTRICYGIWDRHALRTLSRALKQWHTLVKYQRRLTARVSKSINWRQRGVVHAVFVSWRGIGIADAQRHALVESIYIKCKHRMVPSSRCIKTHNNAHENEYSGLRNRRLLLRFSARTSLSQRVKEWSKYTKRSKQAYSRALKHNVATSTMILRLWGGFVSGQIRMAVSMVTMMKKGFRKLCRGVVGEWRRLTSKSNGRATAAVCLVRMWKRHTTGDAFVRWLGACASASLVAYVSRREIEQYDDDDDGGVYSHVYMDDDNSVYVVGQAQFRIDSESARKRGFMHQSNLAPFHVGAARGSQDSKDKIGHSDAYRYGLLPAILTWRNAARELVICRQISISKLIKLHACVTAVRAFIAWALFTRVISKTRARFVSALQNCGAKIWREYQRVCRDASLRGSMDAFTEILRRKWLKNESESFGRFTEMQSVRRMFETWRGWKSATVQREYRMLQQEKAKQVIVV